VTLASNTGSARAPLSIRFELCHGRHGASARVELHEGPGGRLAQMGVGGFLDDVALGRFERAMSDLVAHGVDGLVLECTQLRHVEFRLLPRLLSALSAFADRPAGCRVAGLSPHLRDLFDLAGADERLWLQADGRHGRAS
jgi:anti-anti-sigma regulatory factor